MQTTSEVSEFQRTSTHDDVLRFVGGPTMLRGLANIHAGEVEAKEAVLGLARWGLLDASLRPRGTYPIARVPRIFPI